MPISGPYPDISVIVHYNDSLPYPNDSFLDIVRSVFQQYGKSAALFILDEENDAQLHTAVSSMNTESNRVQYVRGDYETRGEWLNAALSQIESQFVLYIDNTHAAVQLRSSALITFHMAAERNPTAGMFYADYEITGADAREVHLLKHHEGRLRDNQDYGPVLFFRREALLETSGFQASLKYNTLYDCRLRISEKFTLVHISNRYDGSLYSVAAPAKGHNVFDYLLASKESQLEAEQVLSDHLKRIHAYLEPAAHFQARPSADPGASLKASIIIPVNNRAEFIGNAIESVLEQTIQNVEVIVVVNGGEKDPTCAAVHKYMNGGEKFLPGKPEVRLIVLDVNNIGLCLNIGAQNAKGEYYVQLDSDDRLMPDAVEKILAVYDSDPNIGMVIGSYEVWQLDDRNGTINRVEEIPVVTHDEWTDENGRNNLLRINGAGAPRSIPIAVIKKIGYFGINDEPFARNYGEDYEMVLKISERYRIGRVWDPIYKVVRHSGGTDHSIDQSTIDRNDEAKDYMRKQAVERRKKMNLE